MNAKGGRPREPGANTVAVTTKLPEDLALRLEAVIARKNARAAQQGLGQLKVSECLRGMVASWVVAEEAREGVIPVSEPSPPLAAPTNGRVGVEVTVARPTHTRRPVATPEATARPPVMGRAQDLDIQREAAERSVIPNGNGHHPVEDGSTEAVDAEGSGLTDDDVADMLKDAPL